MIIIKQPPAIHTAFNPAILQLAGKSGDYAYIAIIPIDITVDETIHKKREFFNGTALFDLSKIVQDYFDDNQTFIMPDKIFIDNNLVQDYKLFESNSGHGIIGAPIDFVAINAVAQIGESSDMTKRKGTFLTGFERLKKYPGYDLTVSVLGFDDNTSVRIGGTNIATVEIVHANIIIPDDTRTLSISTGGKYVNLETNQAEIITNNEGEPIYIRFLDGSYTERIIYIDNRCLPSSPFYVKWINQIGGWDYWMFSFRQTISRSIGDQQFFNPTVFNQETVNGTTQLTDISATEKVTVGADGLTDNEYECISKLIYSPQKQWYSEKLNKWIEIQLEEGEAEKDTRVKSQQIELTFVMPDPQLQF